MSPETPKSKFDSWENPNSDDGDEEEWDTLEEEEIGEEEFEEEEFEEEEEIGEEEFEEEAFEDEEENFDDSFDRVRNPFIGEIGEEEQEELEELYEWAEGFAEEANRFFDEVEKSNALQEESCKNEDVHAEEALALEEEPRPNTPSTCQLSTLTPSTPKEVEYHENIPSSFDQFILSLWQFLPEMQQQIENGINANIKLFLLGKNQSLDIDDIYKCLDADIFGGVVVGSLLLIDHGLRKPDLAGLTLLKMKTYKVHKVDYYVTVIELLQLLVFLKSLPEMNILETFKQLAPFVKSLIPEHIIEALLTMKMKKFMLQHFGFYQTFKQFAIKLLADKISSGLSHAENYFNAKGPAAALYSLAVTYWLEAFMNGQNNHFWNYLLRASKSLELGTTHITIFYDEGYEKIPIHLEVLSINGVVQTTKTWHVRDLSWGSLLQMVEVLYHCLSVPKHIYLSFDVAIALEGMRATKTLKMFASQLQHLPYTSKKDEFLYNITYGSKSQVHKYAKKISSKVGDFRMEFVLDLGEKEISKLFQDNGFELKNTDRYIWLVKWACIKAEQNFTHPLKVQASTNAKAQFNKVYHLIRFDGLSKWGPEIKRQQFINECDFPLLAKNE